MKSKIQCHSVGAGFLTEMVFNTSLGPKRPH